MHAKVPKFFVTLLHSATQAHMLHLKSKSYAQHMALGELYEGLPGLADELIEAYQGCHGEIVSYPSITVAPADDALRFVSALKSFIANNRDCIEAEYTQLQNIVDEILARVNKTEYKLRNLS